MQPVAAPTRAVSRDLPAYLAAIGLSAFLMFSLELLAGRLVLPVFGGSPAVWTTSLCFFTGVLFVGYLYAHVLATRLRPAAGASVHVLLVAIAFLVTLAAPVDVASLRNPSLPEAVNVLAALAVLVGPAAFVLSTTSPLLSSWFGRSGRDPWWLYAVSNGASLAGLLAYPFLVEPTFPLSVQRMALVAGFGIYGVLLAVTALAAMRLDSGPTAGPTDGPTVARRTTAEPTDGPTPGPTAAPSPINPARVLRWLVAAMVPAGLLSATTTFLATDLVSAPLLWIGPLAIYLASMTIAFSARGRRLLRGAELLVPTAATLLWIPYVLPVGWPIAALVVLVLGAFGVLATAIHGRLALDRPGDAHLTFFYLVVSAGGLLATGFVALAAPLLFQTILEYPLLLVAGTGVLALMAGPQVAAPGRGARAFLAAAGRRLASYGAAALVLLVLVALGGGADPAIIVAIVLLLVIGAVIVAAARSTGVLAVLTAGAVVVFAFAISTHPLLRVRTFFGVTEVREAADGAAHALFSGTTLHGVQFLDERSSEPTAYYVAAGPAGDVFADLAARAPGGGSIGVVGLGSGVLAAYGRPGDSITYFEIDQAVIDIASDPRWFNYLSRSWATTKVVKGDARLSLDEVAPASFDVLVLDAFSSDMVPVHLLTKEAMEGYARLLRPGGVIAFHVSNRFYDLPGVVVATARAIGLGGTGREYSPPDELVRRLVAKATSWVVVGAPDAVARYTAAGWREPAKPGPVLTDDFADLLHLLRPLR